MLKKNEIPILEYDDTSYAVIMPTHEKLDIKLPKKAVQTFITMIKEDLEETRLKRRYCFVWMQWFRLDDLLVKEIGVMKNEYK